MRLINGIQCYCRGNWNRQDKGSLKAKITLEYFQNNAQDPVFQVGKKKEKKEKSEVEKNAPKAAERGEHRLQSALPRPPLLP